MSDGPPMDQVFLTNFLYNKHLCVRQCTRATIVYCRINKIIADNSSETLTQGSLNISILCHRGQIESRDKVQVTINTETFSHRPP